MPPRELRVPFYSFSLIPSLSLLPLPLHFLLLLLLFLFFSLSLSLSLTSFPLSLSFPFFQQNLPEGRGWLLWLSGHIESARLKISIKKENDCIFNDKFGITIAAKATVCKENFKSTTFVQWPKCLEQQLTVYKWVEETPKDGHLKIRNKNVGRYRNRSWRDALRGILMFPKYLKFASFFMLTQREQLTNWVLTHQY